MIFRCIRSFSLHLNGNLSFILLERRRIVQVVQTNQNGCTEVLVAEFDLNLASPTQINIHNVYNLLKEYVTKCYKVINKLICNLSFVR